MPNPSLSNSPLPRLLRRKPRTNGPWFAGAGYFIFQAVRRAASGRFLHFEVQRMKLGITFDFEKSDKEGRYVRGWASVVSIAGKPVTDADEDFISMGELRKSAHDFITDARVAKAMHKGSAVGEVVESVIIDDDFAKAMGASTDKRGWWIGMSVNDPAIRKRVKSGELRAFSIGGRGKRRKMED